MNAVDHHLKDGMNESAVRQLAQSDPVPNLTATYAEDVQNAKRHVADLTRLLRQIDETAAKLAEHGVTVSVDLGPVGNQAAAARRDLERDTGRTFEMPRHDRG